MNNRILFCLFFTLLSSVISLEAQYTLEIKIPTAEREGTVLLGLYNGPDLYLEKEGMIRHCQQEVKEAFTICLIEDLPAGTYSAAMLLDLNGNHEMDFNFVGWPKEGYGFYPDPGFLMRKPRFEECHFELSGDMSVDIRVR